MKSGTIYIRLVLHDIRYKSYHMQLMFIWSVSKTRIAVVMTLCHSRQPPR